MNVRTRITKAAVLEQVNHLRDAIRNYTDMSDNELSNAYRQLFTSDVINVYTRDYMLRSILMSATYYMTNVLGLE